MNSGRTVFWQLIDFLPTHQFSKCVTRYYRDFRVRKFTRWDQFPCLSFTQLTYCESLRDIVSCMGAMCSKLYHAGIRGHIRAARKDR